MKSKTQLNIAAIIFPVLIIVLGIVLMVKEFIGETSLLTLILVSVLLGIFIQYNQLIDTVSWKEGKIVLRDMKKVESQIKELGKAFIKVIETRRPALLINTPDDDRLEEEEKQALDALKQLVES